MPPSAVQTNLTNRPLRAARVVRVSTAEQGEGSGLQSQYDVTDRIIARNGYALVASFELVDVSGTAMAANEVPEFNRLIQMVENRQCDVIVARELSRIVRPDTMAGLQVFDILKRNNCIIAAGDLTIDFSSANGWLSGGLHALIAGFDRLQLLNRMQQARESRRIRGLLASSDSTLPTGVSYDWDNEKFYYDDEIHKIVRAFELIDAHGLRNLSEVGRQVGMLGGSLKRLLRNELYIGIRSYTHKANPAVKRIGPNGRQGYRPKIKRAPEETIRVTVIQEPAVSPERFARVQAVLREIHYNYTKHNAEIRYVNLATGIGRCAICGHVLYSTANGKCRKDGTKTAGFLACKSHHPRSKGKLPKCGNGWMGREEVDALMIGFCREKLTAPETLTAIIESSVTRSAEVIRPFPEQARSNAIEKLRRQEIRLLDLAVAGLLTIQQTRERQSKIREEITTLERAELEARASRPKEFGLQELAALVVRGAFAFVRMTDRVEQKKILEGLFSEVFIRRDRKLRAVVITAFRFSAELLAGFKTALPTGIVNLNVPFMTKKLLPEGFRRCPACEQALPIGEFWGNQSRCKSCKTADRLRREKA